MKGPSNSGDKDDPKDSGLYDSSEILEHEKHDDVRDKTSDLEHEKDILIASREKIYPEGRGIFDTSEILEHENMMTYVTRPRTWSVRKIS